MLATPTLDQDESGSDDETAVVESDNEEKAIVVTGSRIRRDTFSTIEPITVVTSDDINQGGFNFHNKLGQTRHDRAFG